MNLLVTAGNTLVPIDKVRGITNIFTGRTGAAIALEALRRGHDVTLLTSHPEAVSELLEGTPPPSSRWSVRRYLTFDELHDRLEALVTAGGLDAIVHCAAVSDYRPAGVYATAQEASFDPARGTGPLIDRAAGKVKSDEPELWLRLVRTPKLIDLMRKEWGYQGLLIKFKLEVGKTDEELLDIAERSRCQSAADLIVANTPEGASWWAYVGPIAGQ